MWVLFIVLLNAPPGIPNATPLETYPSQVECDLELKRITAEMHLAYPGDESFTLVCKEQ